MNEDARDFEDDNIEEAVARFNDTLITNASEYFDVFEIDGIVDQFLEDGQIELAKKSCRNWVETASFSYFH